MGRQLSRVESEYVLSEAAELKPPLEISLLQSPPQAASTAAICRPQSYTFNPNSMSFFFDGAFIAESKIPRGVPCRFCFFYKTRRVCFTAAISSVGGKSFCRAGALFYADEESPFSPSVSGKLLFRGDGLSAALGLRVHRDFPLNTADKDKRKELFCGFAKSALGEAAFRELEASASLAPEGASGILFYLDCKEALACFTLKAAASLFAHGGQESATDAPASRPMDRAALGKKIGRLKGLPLACAVSLKFGPRGIEAEGTALAEAFGGSLLFCAVSLLGLVPENVRFLYEMSRGEKYTGGETP